MKLVLFSILKKPRYLLNALIFSLTLGLTYPLIQVAPQGLNNFWFWSRLLKPIDWLVYLSYSLIFGLSLAVFLWRTDQQSCSPNKLWRSGVLGIFSSFLATTLPLCPQCLSFLTLALPAVGVSFLAQYRLWLMIGTVALLILALWLLGGFERLEEN